MQTVSARRAFILCVALLLIALAFWIWTSNRCTPTKLLDVTVGGARLSIPTSWQPSLDHYKQPIRTVWNYGSDGRQIGRNDYCRPSKLWQVERSIGFDELKLKNGGQDGPKLAETLQGIPRISLDGDVRPPIHRTPIPNVAVLGPQLFGSDTLVWCANGLWAGSPGENCRFTGRTPEGFSIQFDLNHRLRPTVAWPKAMQDVEAFYRRIEVTNAHRNQSTEVSE